MNADLRAVWEQYVAAWKAGAPEAKLALCKECLAPECVYRDPLTEAKGWDELVAYMLEFRKQVPGGYFVTREFMTHHQRSVAKWSMLNGDGVPIGEGVSYGEYNDAARLVTMTGFFETQAPEP